MSTTTGILLLSSLPLLIAKAKSSSTVWFISVMCDVVCGAVWCGVVWCGVLFLNVLRYVVGAGGGGWTDRRTLHQISRL